MTQKSVLTRILALTNQECVIAECEEAMNMTPMSTFEFTPEEIRALIFAINVGRGSDILTRKERATLGHIRPKLEFALKRFEPHGAK